MYHKSPARSTYSSEKVAYLIFPTVTVSLDLNSRYGSKVACDWPNNKTPPLNIKALTGRQEWFGYERLTTFMSWLGVNADCNYCADAYKNLKIVNFCVFCKTQPHTPNKTREKKNRNKTHLTSHYHAHCPFDWSAGFSEAFRAHMIGWYWQQSRLIAKGLDGRLGGSQVSNVWGDNLRVDKNDLSQLKHFGTEFVLVFFLLTGWVLNGPRRQGLRYPAAKPHASAEPWTWSHCLTSRPPHDRERGKWDFIVQS